MKVHTTSKSAASALLVVLGTVATMSADAAPRKRIGLPAGMKTTDTVELASGEKVSAARYQDELNKLQEAIESNGFSLRKSDGKAPRGKIAAFPGQAREAAEDKAAFTAKIGKLRQRQASGFKDLIKGRVALERGGPAPFARPGGGTSPSSPPEPRDEPLSMTYEESLGKKDKAAIYVAFGLEDRGDAESVGCEGGLEGGVYLFSEKRPLAKAVLKGSANSTTISGGLELYLAGKMVDGFPKSGSNSLPALTKSINPPEIKYGYGWNPISIQITASVAGELGITLKNTQTKGAGSTKGSCTIGVTPFVRGSARATASVAAVAFKVGVEGNITLFDLKLPATTTIALQSNPLAFREDFDVSLDSSYLDGSLGFFVQTNVPRRGEKLWDVDWNTIYRKTFFEWDGFSANQTLAHFAAKQTPFQ